MNVSALLFDTLRGLVGNRCYPSTFPQDPVWPGIRYTLTRDAHPALCFSDFGETDTSQVQLDVVAQSYGAAKLLRDQVVAALGDAWVREFESETYDTETKTHRVILQGTFHPSSEVVE